MISSPVRFLFMLGVLFLCLSCGPKKPVQSQPDPAAAFEAIVQRFNETRSFERDKVNTENVRYGVLKSELPNRRELGV